MELAITLATVVLMKKPATLMQVLLLMTDHVCMTV
jgi:hypothetical protein